MSSRLHHGCARVPVTALAFSGQYILAAEGPFLRIFARHGPHLLLSEKVFQDQAIHALKVVGPHEEGSSTVAAYGGNFVRLIRINHRRPCQLSICQGTVASVSDWILDFATPLISSSVPGTESTADAQTSSVFGTVVVTAHNALIRLSWDDASRGSSPTENGLDLTACNLTTSSRCILYSAHLSWLSDTKILIAAGTAFGEILVWSCDFRDLSKPKTSVHHFFTGHEGSIFGVQISPGFSLAKDDASRRRLLASCSDDRTIRIWDVSHLPEGGDLSTSEDALGLAQDRETGFGANVTSDRDECLAVAWGHTSRVWAVHFIAPLPDADQRLSRIVSFGEDSTCRIWQIDCDFFGTESTPGVSIDVKLLCTRAFHSGKSIWSMAISPLSKDAFDIVTAAADSAIVGHRWPAGYLEYASPEPGKDAHRCHAFVSQQCLVSATNSGQVLKGKIQDGDMVWRVLGQLNDLKGYSIATSLPDLEIVFLAGTSGNIYCYDEASHGLCSIARVNRKVSGLFDTLVSTQDGESTISLIVTQVGALTAEHLLLSHKPTGLSVIRRVSLELPPSFIVTSASYVITKHDILVFMGTRSGKLAIFTGLSLERDQEGDTYKHSSVHALHAPEAITALQWIPADPCSISLLGHLVSVGRDGRCSATRIYSDKPAVLVHQSSLPFGPNAEGCYVDPISGSLKVYGFRSKQFVLYNASTEQEILSVECGGAHRIWSFCPTPNGIGGTFVWNQAGTLKLYSSNEMLHQVVRSGGHGRDIKSVAASPTDPNIIATGAEDTTIRIFEYAAPEYAEPDFRCVRVIRKHITGIQHLEWSQDGRYLFSSGGYEEFFVWRIRKVPVIGIGVVCEAVCPLESETPDLRIMSFAAEQKIHGNAENEERDVEFLITMVYSDSTIRRYSYVSTATVKEFQLLLTGTYLTSCLMHCTYLSSSQILTAGTDGHIAFWPSSTSTGATVSDGPTELGVTMQSKIHQSTIKTLSWTRVSSDTVLLLTGGDDNGLAFSLIRNIPLEGETHHSPQTSTLLIPRAHAATITSSVLLPSYPGSTAMDSDGNISRFLAVTSGNDQRIKAWEVRVNMKMHEVEGVNVKRLMDVGTPVADVADMAYLGARTSGGKDVKRTIVVVGVGMEAWELDLSVEGERRE